MSLPDLNSLTVEQLYELSKQTSDSISQKESASRQAEEEQEEAERVKKYPKLLKEYYSLKQELEAVQKTHTLTLTLPITFELGVKFDGEMLKEYGYEDYTVKAKASIDKDAKLSGVQQSLLQNGLNRLVSDACSEILRLSPGLDKQLNKLIHRAETLMFTLDDMYSSPEDLLKWEAAQAKEKTNG